MDISCEGRKGIFRKIISILLGALFLPAIAFASSISVTNDVTILLPSDSSQYLLKASSSFDTLSAAVSASSFSFVMNPGDTVTVTSSDNRTLSNTLNTSTTCGPPSSVQLTVSSSQTVTVTPGGACTTPPPAPAVSSGGGWSGGCSTYPQGEVPSWGVVPCTPTNPSQGAAVLPGTQSSPTSTSSPPSVQSQGSTSQNGVSLTLSKNHQIWDRGEDIRALQQWLNANGFIIAAAGPGSPGSETSIFGTHTYQALIKFQQSKNLPQTGYLGPLTRAALASMSTTTVAR
jgi:Putative peptidoglycan binding domain